MNLFKKKQLIRVIEAIGNAANATKADVDRIINNYVKYDDYEKVINDLTYEVYKLFGETQEQLCEYSLDMIRTIGSPYFESIDAMKKYSKERIRKNVQVGFMNIEDNNKLVEDTLRFTCNIFNEKNIDYYVVGGVAAILLTTKKFNRYHDDIDFIINRKDIKKLEEVFEDSDYDFIDNRLNSSKIWNSKLNRPMGEHELIANNKNNEFHIGFYEFRRRTDNSIVVREYYKENDETKIFESIIPKELSDLKFSDEIKKYKDIQFKSCTVESVYNIKKYIKRDKDLDDLKKMEKYVDNEKVDRIHALNYYFSKEQIIDLEKDKNVL